MRHVGLKKMVRAKYWYSNQKGRIVVMIDVSSDVVGARLSFGEGVEEGVIGEEVIGSGVGGCFCVLLRERR